MELDEELLSKVELVTALDEHALIAGEFEYDYSDNTLYCGYSSENWKGVTTANVNLRIEPFPVIGINVLVKYFGRADISLRIKEFETYVYSIDSGYYGEVKIDSLSFTRMELKEYNVSTEYVGNCSVSLTFEKGE